MGLKKSKFAADTAIPAGSTFDFVINGQNFKITKEDLLTALGVTGTIEQEGAVTGTPVLDVDGTAYKIRNVENGLGIFSSISPENGLEIAANLVAGTNVSIVDDGSGALEISAAVGEVANTVVVQDKDDFPAPSGGVITLAVASYTIKGNINLGSDRIFMTGGSQIIGDTATLSSITTSSASPTITAGAGGFAACTIQGNGGLEINNTSSGAAIRVEDTDTICFMSRLLTRNAGCALEINDSNIVVESWTVLSGVTDGIRMTGTSNGGPIIRDFNPINILGRMIDIQGSVASGSTRIENLLGTSALEAVRLDAGTTLPSMELSGDVLALGTSAIVLPGTITEGLLFNRLKAISGSFDGCDLTGGYIENFTCTSTGLISGAAGGAGLKGDAGSANIGSAAIVSNCSIQGVGAGGVGLSGISKKDLKWSFSKAGPQITDSTNIGGFTLDAQATTTINYQGFDGLVVAFSDPGGGVNTTVDIGAHAFANGTPVSILGTVAYNGLFTMANVTATTFDIVRTFVTAEVVGEYQTGWTKISGATTDIATIERFSSPSDNALESLDGKELPVVYSAVISGEKSGATPRLFQFALFSDMGSGFTKIDGEATIDATNRVNSTNIRVPFDISTNEVCTSYCRNMEGLDDFVCDSLNVDIGVS